MITAEHMKSLRKLEWMSLPTDNFPAWKRVEIRECEHVHEFLEAGWTVFMQCEKCGQQWYESNDEVWSRIDEVSA